MLAARKNNNEVGHTNNLHWQEPHLDNLNEDFDD
jgi:hypothetical protein